MILKQDIRLFTRISTLIRQSDLTINAQGCRLNLSIYISVVTVTHDVDDVFSIRDNREKAANKFQPIINLIFLHAELKKS